ncbi:hypothetical protein, partial [Roseobacter sp. HKCCD5862]
ASAHRRIGASAHRRIGASAHPLSLQSDIRPQVGHRARVSGQPDPGIRLGRPDAIIRASRNVRCGRQRFKISCNPFALFTPIGTDGAKATWPIPNGGSLSDEASYFTGLSNAGDASALSASAGLKVVF